MLKQTDSRVGPPRCPPVYIVLVLDRIVIGNYKRSLKEELKHTESDVNITLESKKYFNMFGYSFWPSFKK